MRGYVAFIKKEWMESVRSYRLFILCVAFLFFGVTSSLMAKLMPEILASMPMEGMTIIVPEPTAYDSYTQFFKNVSQMGSIVLLLVFSGVVSGELARGTLIPMLTKGLGRTSALLAKYTMMSFLWTAVYSGSALISYGYTVFLFPNDTVQHVVYSLFLFWVFGQFLLSLLLLGSVLIKGNYGGVSLTVGVIGCLFVISMFPQAAEYNPLQLASVNVSLLNGMVEVSETYKALNVTVMASVGSVIGAIVVFRKKAI